MAQVWQQRTALIGGQIDFKGKDAVFHVRDKDHAVPDVDAPGALEHVIAGTSCLGPKLARLPYLELGNTIRAFDGAVPSH